MLKRNSLFQPTGLLQVTANLISLEFKHTSYYELNCTCIYT